MKRWATNIPKNISNLLESTIISDVSEELEEGQVAWGLYEDKKLIGCAKISESHEPEKYESYIQAFAICENKQGNGFGKYFANKLIEKYKSLSLEALDKKSQLFWKAIGFKKDLECSCIRCNHMNFNKI